MASGNREVPMSQRKQLRSSFFLLLYEYCVEIKVEIALNVFITLSKVIAFCGQGQFFSIWTQNINAINKQR
jgi:hypothetical protein